MTNLGLASYGLVNDLTRLSKMTLFRKLSVFPTHCDFYQKMVPFILIMTNLGLASYGLNSVFLHGGIAPRNWLFMNADENSVYVCQPHFIHRQTTAATKVPAPFYSKLFHDCKLYI